MSLTASAMFSSWWNPNSYSRTSLHDNPETLITSFPEKTTSFRLSSSHNVCTILPKLKQTFCAPQLHDTGSNESPDECVSSSEALASSGSSSKGEFCKIVNLRIPLPSFHPDSPRLPSQGGGGGGGGRRSQCGAQEGSRRLSTPKLKQLEFLAFGGDQPLTPDLQAVGRRKIATSTATLHASSFLASLIEQRESRGYSSSRDPPAHQQPPPLSNRDSLNLPPRQAARHSSHLRKPHPSTEYPDLSVSSQRLGALSTVKVSHWSIQDCVLRYSHCRRGDSYSEGLGSCLAKMRLNQPPLLVESHRTRVARIHSCARKSSEEDTIGLELPPLSFGNCSKEGTVNEATCTALAPSLQAEGHRIRKHTPRSRQTRLVTIKSTLLKDTQLALYPDPLAHAPPSYKRRLAHMAALVAETVQWEKGRRNRKSKSNNNGSEGSL